MSSMLVHPDALPAAAGSSTQITRRAAGLPPFPPADPSKRKILVVDADRECVRLMEFVLSIQGYEVTAVSDLSSACALVSTEEFGQIVMDTLLPDGSGLELVRLVREQLGLRTPITIVSGLRQQHVYDECMAAGANEYVTKPFSPSELIMRLGRWTTK